MVLSIIYKLDTKSIDFVLAFPQAELDRDILWNYHMDSSMVIKENMS